MRHSTLVRPLIGGALLASVLAPSTAVAQEPAPAPPPDARMTVTVDVMRFTATRGGTVAEGKATVPAP